MKLVARKNGWNITPENFERGNVGQNGLVTISNLQVNSSRFLPFNHTALGKRKGILVTEFEIEKLRFKNANLHTDYSDFNRASLVHLEHLKQTATLMNQEEDLWFVSGDFNTGSNASFRNEVYNSSDALWDDGFLNLVENEWTEGIRKDQVTWSLDNSLTRYIPKFIQILEGVDEWDDENGALDHVLFRVSQSIFHEKTEITFTEKFKNPDECFLEDKEINISDHFGVRSTFKIGNQRDSTKIATSKFRF